MLTLFAIGSVWDSCLWLAREIFGGDYPTDPLKLHQIVARATAVFFIGLVIVRLGKSRLIGRVTALDVILGFMLGSLLSRGITGHASISGTATASATIVSIHFLLTFISCRSHAFGTLIKGHSFPLVKDGRIDERAMLHSHITPNDLGEEMRLKGVETVDEVHRAYKERNGEISIIPRKSLPKIVEVAVQAGVQTIRIEISS